MPTIIVIAKAPRPGRSKTRLTPPCTPEQAARLAEAALADTLAAVSAVGDVRRVVALDGPAGAWLPAGFDIVPQRPGGLDARLAGAFDDVMPEDEGGGGCLLIGMDTPQVTSALLAAAVRTLTNEDVDAVLGPSLDGGFWSIGLRRADPAVFLGVPMSTEHTGRDQRRRLARLGLRTATLPTLRDVDEIADARAVATGIPRSRFARALRRMEPTWRPVTA